MEVQEGVEQDLFRTNEEDERSRKQHLHLGRLQGEEKEEGGGTC